MLRALRDFTWRIIGQPIIPRVRSGLAASDRVILIPPRVIIVGELVQRRSRHADILILESVGINVWSRLGDQGLVRNVWVTLRRRLRARTAHNNPKENDD